MIVFRHTAEHYRSRAVEALAMSESMPSPFAQNTMAEIAATFELLARSCDSRDRAASHPADSAPQVARGVGRRLPSNNRRGDDGPHFLTDES